MEYRSLGRTGVKVSELCLGAMMFGKNGNPDHEDCIRIIHRALDAGINFIDTANVYSRGESEEIVGKALKGRRHQVVLATKVHGAMGDGPNDRGNSRLHIMREVENSLRRLGTDYIDLYQIHRPDPTVPIDETLRALDDLVRQGKVRYVGSSTYRAWQLMEALWTSDRLGLVRFDTEQPPYSIFHREIEEEILPACRAYNLGVIPWSPLDGGWLTGKYRLGQPFPEGSRMARNRQSPDDPVVRRKLELVEELIKLASARNLTLSQFALAWMLTQPGITSPIIGPRTMEQLEDNLGAVGVRLTQEEMARVDELVPPGTRIGPQFYR